MSIRQSLSLARLPNHGRANEIYCRLMDLLKIDQREEGVTEKVNTLAAYVRDTRGALYQKLALWVSLLPSLTMTSALLWGPYRPRFHVQTSHHYSRMMGPALWLLFMSFFLILSIILDLMIFFEYRMTVRTDPIGKRSTN